LLKEAEVTTTPVAPVAPFDGREEAETIEGKAMRDPPARTAPTRPVCRIFFNMGFSFVTDRDDPGDTRTNLTDDCASSQAVVLGDRIMWVSLAKETKRVITLRTIDDQIVMDHRI
jgi:hypothetical protein